MLKACHIGLGGIGMAHFNNYLRINKENAPLRLAAVCDVDEKKFECVDNTCNIDGLVSDGMSTKGLNTYTSVDEMLIKEKPDFVSIALPTYLHADVAVKCMEAGAHVFCEKPMALTLSDCDRMIETSKKTGKRLMIGQVLRFWSCYEVLKETISSGKYGKPISAYFFRGGNPPSADDDSWFFSKEKSGGCVLDQHVHDVDMINYLFGTPLAVCSNGVSARDNGALDSVSTNYIFKDGFAVNSQDDWSIKGCSFYMEFRVNLKLLTLVLYKNVFHVYDKDGKDITPQLDGENAYYKELMYFADCIVNNKPNTVNPPEQSRQAIKIALAELDSATQGGYPVKL